MPESLQHKDRVNGDYEMRVSRQRTTLSIFNKLSLEIGIQKTREIFRSTKNVSGAIIDIMYSISTEIKPRNQSPKNLPDKQLNYHKIRGRTGWTAREHRLVAACLHNGLYATVLIQLLGKRFRILLCQCD